MTSNVARAHQLADQLWAAMPNVAVDPAPIPDLLVREIYEFLRNLREVDDTPLLIDAQNRLAGLERLLKAMAGDIGGPRSKKVLGS